ncbi:hypothetical protein PAXRUDRAFT_291078 [Paxillus rubicundulus Ve08.2h10]|uniref:Uncharacterized protein n=1 Tax=Paxillus rubicundulus Ve08.2h10 TaxID=930991 RepID=A0A0D0C8A3_9AGAM|nr:hypothetical protein PAXRUDRAFT_291078 [Paxillus rubicundulus Ve08.2h10]
MKFRFLLVLYQSMFGTHDSERGTALVNGGDPGDDEGILPCAIVVNRCGLVSSVGAAPVNPVTARTMTIRQHMNLMVMMSRAFDGCSSQDHSFTCPPSLINLDETMSNTGQIPMFRESTLLEHRLDNIYVPDLQPGCTSSCKKYV